MVRLDANPPSVSKEIGEEVEEVEITDEIKLPPTNLYSDEPPLETDFHREQIDLLIRLLKYWWRDEQSPAPKGYRQDFYISGNLTVYYNEQQIKKRDFRGPDVFVVLGAEKRDRRSWAIWEEGGKYPNVVIELLSSSTATIDRGAKKELYQDVWRVPNYFWFHPETLEFEGFHLVDGLYEAIVPTDAGRLWSDQLELFLGIHERQLRWFSEEGQLVPLPEDAERQAKMQERQAKEQAQQKAEQLEALLRRYASILESQGIDPNQLPE